MFEYIKKLVKSWTLWFNSAVATLIAFVEFGLPQLAASLPMLQGMIPANFYATLLIGSTVVNILLRFKTSTSLKDK